MAGRQLARTNAVGQLDHGVDPQRTVAAHAGVRRHAGSIAVDEETDDLAPEGVLEVEGQVRYPDLVSKPSSAPNRLRRAAGLGPVGVLVGPQLQGYGDDLGATLALEQRGHRRVDTAAEGDEDPLARRRPGQRSTGTCQRRDRAAERVGDQLGGVTGVRIKATDQLGDSFGAKRGGTQDRLAIELLGKRRCTGAQSGTAVGFEADGLDCAAAAGEQRDADQITAGRATGGAAESPLGLGSAASRIPQIVVEQLGAGHRPRLGDRATDPAPYLGE